MTQERPQKGRPKAKSDVMQAALQAEAFAASQGEEPLLLQQADDADPVARADGEVDAEYDEHEWDDVVQQTFPASDPPPPSSRSE